MDSAAAGACSPCVVHCVHPASQRGYESKSSIIAYLLRALPLSRPAVDADCCLLSLLSAAGSCRGPSWRSSSSTSCSCAAAASLYLIPAQSKETLSAQHAISSSGSCTATIVPKALHMPLACREALTTSGSTFCAEGFIVLYLYGCCQGPHQ